MYYGIKLIYFIIFLSASSALWAQDIRYRVEVLILTHLNHNEEALETQELPDYSNATDFLTPSEESDETDAATTPATEQAPGANEALLPALSEEPEPDPNALVHIEEMSEVMREAWRRLRLSAPFRPQQYLSWEQGDQEPFPTLRVHDLQVIMSKDPLARERLEFIRADLLESESEENEQRYAEAVATGQLERSELLQEPAAAMPGPVTYHRLDGAVTLRRSRFLHLDLDVQMREGIWEPEPLLLISQYPPIFERAGPTTFKVFEMRQSRQVKTERMEYFDGPVLSALAYITSVKVTSEDSTQ
ncbi:CsiV family protein [Pseudomonadota bacterium]